MISRNRTTTMITGALAALALLLGTTACGASDSDCQGDPGKVIEKDYDSNGKAADDYDVTVLRSDPADVKAAGKETYEKDVSSTAYDWVSNGSRWPSAKHCEDGKVKG